MNAPDPTPAKTRPAPAAGRRRGVIALAALTALGSALPAQAALVGTVYAAPGFDVVVGSSGYLELSGYLDPNVAAGGPDATIGGSAAAAGMGVGSAQYYVGGASGYLGYRGLVVTPTGSYALGTLGTNSVADLGPVGMGYSTTQSVSDAGVIAGTSELWADGGTKDLGQRAVWWAAGETTPHALALPPHFTDTTGTGYAGASTSSPGGVIIGWATPYKGDVSEGNRVLRWMTPDSPPEVLQRLPGMSEWGGNRSSGVAVNDAGAVVGQGPYYDAAGLLVGTSAIRWDAGTTAATPLGHLGSAADGTFRSSANAIDRRGTAVGMSFKYDDAHKPLGIAAVRWPAKSSHPVELGGLGTGPDGQSWTYAVGIADSGTIFGVGQQFSPTGVSQGWRVIRWLPGKTTPIALEPLSMGLSGSTYEFAYAMNRKGWIAGTANAVLTSTSEPSDPMHLDVHAVVWGPDGTVHDLNKLLPAGTPWKLFGAYAISDSGLVTGIGYYGLESGGQVYYDARMFTMQLTKTGTGE